MSPGRGPRFRSLAAGARRYADQLERIRTLGGLSRPTLRSLARALCEEITAEQDRQRRSRS